MAKDMRHYAKFTLDFPDNPKILPLSDAAFRCLVEMTIWSRYHQTDGFIPRALVAEATAQAGAQPRAKWLLASADELCKNDPLNPSLISTESGWLIRDFAEHQLTKAEVEHGHKQAVIAGRKGGQASAQARAQARGKRTLKQPLKQNASRERESSSSPNGLEQRNAHRASPNGRGAPSRTDTDAIRNCHLCDDRGYIGLRAGPFIQCPHNPQKIQQLEHEYEAAE